MKIIIDFLKITKKKIIVLTLLYFSFGFIFAVYAYSQDLRTFSCDAPNAPHGYVTMGTGTFENPNPENCTRRGFELRSIAIIPFFTVFGIPILILRSINNSN